MTTDDREINPWLLIPASDYEVHMDSPEVGQSRLLNEVFRDVVSAYHPRSMAVIGCTTGNGFEHIDFNITKKVFAIDINAEYLRILRDRFPEHLDCIETICDDVNALELEPNSFDLIHCALIFEYVDPAETVRTIMKWLQPCGVISVVLQLPDEELGAVTDTRYKSLKRLTSIINLIDKEEFDDIAFSNGLHMIKGKIQQLKSGKRFYVSVYSRGSGY